MTLTAPEIIHVCFYSTVLTVDSLFRFWASSAKAATSYVLLCSSNAVKLVKVTPHLLACRRCGGFMMEGVRIKKEGKEGVGVSETEREGERKGQGANELEKTRD